MIVVIKPGILTTVQDEGRWGFQHMGLPVAGPMDLWSHRQANRLVGNDPSAAALEVTLSGPRLRFERDATIAVCGAAFAPRLNERAVDTQRAIDVPAGGELDLGWATRGARATLAVRGGVDAPLRFGSRATHLPSAIGGVEGRALASGDRLAIGTAIHGPVLCSTAPSTLAGEGGAVVRVLPGPDVDDTFPAFLALVASRFEVSSESNRMGYRLHGPAIDMPPADRLSTATPMGTVQVPADGAPIVLMADRQTTGGYTRVACVISADLGLMAQLRPGDWVAFVPCSRTHAWAALAACYAEMVK